MLIEKPRCAGKTAMPALFKAIIENDEALRLTKSCRVVTLADFRDQTVRKRDYMRTAEKTYMGTKNKGTEI